MQASPLNNLNEGWRFADWLSFHPEAMHIITYVFDDVGEKRERWRSSCHAHGVAMHALLTSRGLHCRHPPELPPDERQQRQHLHAYQQGGFWVLSARSSPVFCCDEHQVDILVLTCRPARSPM